MQFTGRLTADAEVRTIKNDRKVTGFTVAVNKRWKDKNGEKHEKTNYVDCAYWVNSGVAEYLKKGTVVDILGWVEAQAWVNRDGDARANLHCDVETLKLYGFTKNNTDEKSGSKKKSGAKAPFVSHIGGLNLNLIKTNIFGFCINLKLPTQIKQDPKVRLCNFLFIPI